MTSAVVVGSGPNGLAAAVVLARAGVDVTVLEAEDGIGGGTRSAELNVPGVLHDICSATHPTGVASPFFRSLDLERHGLEWLWPQVEAAHPLDGGRAGVLFRDLDRTAEGLGADGEAWRRLYAPLVRRSDELIDEIFGPIVHVPRHPVLLARFGLRALQPASWIARRWESDEARALFAGLAAHASHPLSRPTTGGLGLMFGMTGHAYGWPVAKGGSVAIANALAADVVEHGGRLETGHRVTEMPQADIVIFDTSPGTVLQVAGHLLPGRVRRPLRKWRTGPGVFKVDFAVEGGVPWANDWAAQAGTVHLGGTFEEVDAAEREVHAGRMPERPFVLVCQQYLADPGRSVGDVHPVWTYAHVPTGWTGDATEAIIGQIERFAPGFRDRVVAQTTSGPAQLEAHNANYVGGDIGGGANDPWQLVMRPRVSPNPYSLGAKGLYLCSASTPPGGGVHGMGGFHAATAALAEIGG
ncbi:phytoene desaturase family protein [Aeromicrobium chenweiae]|uniref:FAD-dependent oxidoreductase n=1 Tax=Aeromicrobium chenweiae TaxID=2079793 RepID=A0A2S0WQZ1_9ACTN|nr:NAD(P)/FAD-dependent oxidoreductase [Aeromicrobium chenweiae]AWB93678.1 FAD-dependent oxidoreductase [Aeromicrobium chenweiae]TGN30474.1 NAD(P)/FAD-dependent oxidoreductase [Aeromicrobium chenweiae]